jgi:competence protein ComGF
MWGIKKVKKNQGFTLLTALMSLLVLCVITFLLSQISSYLLHVSQTPPILRQDIWNAQHQLEAEAIKGTELRTMSHQLTFLLNGETIQYVQSGNRLIREVNGQGFEIVLLKIKSVTFTEEEGVVTMTITDSEGNEFPWLLRSFMIQ